MEYMPFSGNPLDRVSNEKKDETYPQGLLEDPNGRYLPFWRLSALTSNHGNTGLVWLDQLTRSKVNGAGETVLLGLRDGVPHFAFDLSANADALSDRDIEGAEFSETRGIALALSPQEAGIVAHARSLLDWHNRHRFCSTCGTLTAPRRGGSMRKCDACGAEHFPRTDPVVIMVVWRDDRCLLGRRPGRPAGNFSSLAGFIEQGETIEEAVRREVREEVGIEIDEVTYFASQPWPFPSNLMIGCFAHASSDDFVTDEDEIAEARWFTRQEVQDAVRGEAPEGGLIIPNQVAIAHHLLKGWSEMTAR
jgi:NAD+ diphosphatase